MDVLFISTACLGLQKQRNGLVGKGSCVSQHMEVTEGNHQTTAKVQRVGLFHYLAKTEGISLPFSGG